MDSRDQSFGGFGFPALFESKHRFENQSGGKASFLMRFVNRSHDVHGVSRRSAN